MQTTLAKMELSPKVSQDLDSSTCILANVAEASLGTHNQAVNTGRSVFYSLSSDAFGVSRKRTVKC